jgi:hypothetical protein
VKNEGGAKWMRKAISLLLLFVLWLPPSLSSASAYSMTEAELTQLESIFNELKTVNETLLLESNQSARELIEARKQLKLLLEELTKLKEQLAMLKAESNQAQSDLEKINNELRMASESYKKSVNEANRKIKSLEWQRGILAVVVGFLAIRK